MTLTKADLAHRMEMEKRIVRETVKAMLAAGYAVSVFDSAEWTLMDSQDEAAIMAALMTTDDDWIYVAPPGVAQAVQNAAWIGWVRFVYGNTGWDVICDYHTFLEDVLKPVQELCDKLADGETV